LYGSRLNKPSICPWVASRADAEPISCPNGTFSTRSSTPLDMHPDHGGGLCQRGPRSPCFSCHATQPGPSEREFFIDNRLVRIHFIIVMLRWIGLAPWEFEFPSPGSLTSTFLGPSDEPSRPSFSTCSVHMTSRGSGGSARKINSQLPRYRGTSLIRNCLLLGPYSRTMPRAPRWSYGGGSFL